MILLMLVRNKFELGNLVVNLINFQFLKNFFNKILKYKIRKERKKNEHDNI